MKVKKKILKFSVSLLLVTIMLISSVRTSISILPLATYINKAGAASDSNQKIIIKAMETDWKFENSGTNPVTMHKFTDETHKSENEKIKNIFCVNHGLSISYDNVKTGNDIYNVDEIWGKNDRDQNKAKGTWLIDNFYIAEGMDNDTIEVMKDNLKSILKETEDYNKKYNDQDIDSIVDSLCIESNNEYYNAIYSIEQALLWKYTNNSNDAVIPKLDENTKLSYKGVDFGEVDNKYSKYKIIYTALSEIAEKKGKYESPNATSGGMKAILDDIKILNGKIDVDNNIVTYDISSPGYSFSDLVASKSFEVKVDDQILTSGYNVEISNNKIILKFESSENLAGKKVSLSMNMVGIITDGTYLENTNEQHPNYDGQNLIYLNKGIVKKSITGKATSEISGKYHMNIVKKSATDDSELSDKSNALGGTTFKVSKKVYGQDNVDTKEVTTEEGKESSSIFGDVNIDKNGTGAEKPDTYTIEETNTTEGYEKIDLSNVVIYVYKKEQAGNYVIDYVKIVKDEKDLGSVKSGEEGKEFDINGDGVYDIGLEVSSNGTDFCITIRNPHKKGEYNVKLIKTDLLGNPLTEKETVFSVNGVKQNTVAGEVDVATGKEITEDGQTDEYKIKETSAPAGYELYTGDITLTAIGKELEKSLALDEEKTKLTVNNEELPQGETSKDGYVTWSLDGDTITIKVKNSYFDLELRKWVTQAIVIENGKTVVTETGHKAEDNPEDVVKVDLRKSKLNDVTVKFKYSIRITNKGEIAGEATEIRDDIPKGLKFVAEDNPDWREENGQIVTDKLAGTTLKTGESAEVEIILTWINSEDNLGVLINTAEINKDHNEYGVPDRDSTPGNNVPGEDDIDDAPVMVTVKTGNEIALYISLTLGTAMILVVGIVMIKKKVLVDWE